MLSSVEQAFVRRDERRAPLKTPLWEANGQLTDHVNRPLILLIIHSKHFLDSDWLKAHA